MRRWHLYFASKYRKKVFTQEIYQRLKEVIYETAKRHNIIVHELAGWSDHIHVLVESELEVGNIAQLLKGSSSYALRKEFPELINEVHDKSLWASSYNSKEIIDDNYFYNCKQYIERHELSNS